GGQGPMVSWHGLEDGHPRVSSWLLLFAGGGGRPKPQTGRGTSLARRQRQQQAKMKDIEQWAQHQAQAREAAAQRRLETEASAPRGSPTGSSQPACAKAVPSCAATPTERSPSRTAAALKSCWHARPAPSPFYKLRMWDVLPS
ncbi:unnamed protein product, partial [Prorocentrum cordatum]